MNVIPAILPHSYEHLLEKLERVSPHASLIQIDFCDGIFGLEKTWMPSFGEPLPVTEGTKYQMDCMLIEWKPMLMYFLSTEEKDLPSSVIVHVDRASDADVLEMVSMCQEKNVQLGFSISNDVELEVLFSALRAYNGATGKFPLVQVMGIRNVGEQGQAFDPECIERIKAIKRDFGAVIIQVDGAMRPETAALVRDAGVDTIVVGSYILRHDDVEAAIESLTCIPSASSTV